MSVIHGANYGTPTLDLNFAKNKSLIDTVSRQNLITFTRSQTGREATYVGADGLIKYASADEPRFDHNPVTGESLGLLIEESRTNGVTNSNNLTSLSTTNSTKIPNSAIAPDGSFTAVKVVESAVSGRHFVTGGGNEVSNTRSIYAKAGERRRIYLSDSNISYASFDLISGTIVNFGNCTPTISNVGNGWYRCSIYHTAFNGVCWWGINTDSGTSYESYVGDGVSGVYFWGPQTEVGSFPTSYIPTTGSTVTRSADEASITGTNFSRWYNQSEGTYYAEVFSASPDAETILSSRRDDGVQISNGFVLFSSTLYNRAICYLVSTNNDFINYSPTSGKNRLTVAGSSASTNAYFNSVGGTILASRTPQAFTVAGIKFGGEAPPNAHISRLTYYPTRLQNYQLQQLTK